MTTRRRELALPFTAGQVNLVVDPGPTGQAAIRPVARVLMFEHLDGVER